MAEHSRQDAFETSSMDVSELTVDMLMAVKLIIWDLDDTFWSGNFADGTYAYSHRNHALVKSFTSSGVMNSICSHNDKDRVLHLLKHTGIYRYFIFPQISYAPKSIMVKKILTSCKLRPSSVIFIENELRHRIEVSNGVHGIIVAPAKIMDDFDPGVLPRRDKAHTRLRQYKILEKKANTVKKLGVKTDSARFLRHSQITIDIKKPIDSELNRIVNLVQRAHQLNFTKKQLTKTQLRMHLCDESKHIRYVKVRDRFGDYGICGMYMLDSLTNELNHFVFSCRILGMGVEQYLYHMLGNPTIHICGEVAFELKCTPPPDWITIMSNTVDEAMPESRTDPSSRRRILARGGCDLEAVMSILENKMSIWNIDRELHYTEDDGVHIIWGEHTEIIRSSIDCGGVGQLPAAIRKVPWLPDSIWKTKFGNGEHDVYILSLLQDFGCGTYQHLKSGLVIPGEYFGINLCDPRCDNTLFGVGRSRTKRLGITSTFLQWFRSEFRWGGPVTPGRIAQNLEFILSVIPAHAVLIVLNGSEIAMHAAVYPFDIDQVQRHKLMNNALELFERRHPRVKVMDVRMFVKNRNDLTDCMFHYQRESYVKIAEALSNIILSLSDEMSISLH